LKRFRAGNGRALCIAAGIEVALGKRHEWWAPEWAATIIDMPLPYETRYHLLKYAAGVAERVAAIDAALRLDASLEALLKLTEAL
jgi:hypothetical protein